MLGCRARETNERTNYNEIKSKMKPSKALRIAQQFPAVLSFCLLISKQVSRTENMYYM
jgi:hypothetical protein